MNQKQITEKVSREVGVKKAIVEKIIESVLSLTTEALTRGEKVRLVGFGNFVVRTRASRTGRNPQTGDKISIPSTKSPAFVPGINLKKAVKGK